MLVIMRGTAHDGGRGIGLGGGVIAGRVRAIDRRPERHPPDRQAQREAGTKSSHSSIAPGRCRSCGGDRADANRHPEDRQQNPRSDGQRSGVEPEREWPSGFCVQARRQGAERADDGEDAEPERPFGQRVSP